MFRTKIGDFIADLYCKCWYK